MIISSQICGSNLQKVFTLGDGCWLPIDCINLARPVARNFFSMTNLIWSLSNKPQPCKRVGGRRQQCGSRRTHASLRLGWDFLSKFTHCVLSFFSCQDAPSQTTMSLLLFLSAQGVDEKESENGPMISVCVENTVLPAILAFLGLVLFVFEFCVWFLLLVFFCLLLATRCVFLLETQENLFGSFASCCLLPFFGVLQVFGYLSKANSPIGGISKKTKLENAQQKDTFKKCS